MGLRGSRRKADQALGRYERTLTALMVASAVRVARTRAGMSQAELARRAHTSQPSIARLEQGRVSPTIVSLERIARALGAELVIDFEPLQPIEPPEPAASGHSGSSPPRSPAPSRRGRNSTTTSVSPTKR